MKKVLIIGATSTIAEATARLFAENGDDLFLLARNKQRLDSLSEDLKIRGAGSVLNDVFDVNDFSNHQSIIDKVIASLGSIDIVLIAHGTLPDQAACEKSQELIIQEMNTNAISTISLLSLLANYFEAQRDGSIVTISSVAGDRGRQSNYIYGAAKGAVSIFTQGLRNRLFKYNVNVITVKPGFVDTPMTKEFDKGLLWVKPEVIANGIMRSINRKKDVVYLPAFWWFIMAIIKSIPEKIFKRLSL